MRTQVYSNTILVDQVLILAGQTQSAIYDCGQTSTFGATTLRRILIPNAAGWNASDVTFSAVDILPDLSVQISNPLRVSDLISDPTYTLFNMLAGDSTNLLPYASDSLSKFVVNVSVAPTSDIQIGLILAPIYQSVA